MERAFSSHVMIAVKKMFLFLFNPVFAASAPPTHATQLAALEDFYTALTHGEDWRITYNWNTGGGDFCKWHDEDGHGVTCDANGDVVSLVIPDNNAIGTLPLHWQFDCTEDAHRCW